MSPDRSLILILTLKLTLDRTIYVSGFNSGGVNRIKHIDQIAGGKGVNVARALLSLGWTDLMSIGIVGGTTGKEIVTLLSEDGIPGDYIEGYNPSSIDYILRDTQIGQDTALYDEGQALLPHEIEVLKQKYLSLLPRAKMALLCGKSPCPDSDNFFNWAAEASRIYGVPSVVDTSGEALKQSISARPFMIKPNIDEARQLLDRPLLELSDRIQAARDLCLKGINLVVMSAGQQEVVVGFRGECWVVKPPQLHAGATVGCGDAMVAGFSLGLVQSLPTQDCIRFGVACGSANTLAPATCKLRRETIDELMQQVEIREA